MTSSLYSEYKEKEAPTETPTRKPSFPHEKLRDTLFYMQDILERCQMPFIVLGRIGKLVAESDDPELSATSVELGILKKHYTESGKSTFWSLMDQYHIQAEDEDDIIALEYNGVPVYIRLIRGHYEFFDNPNTKFYFVENIDLPNPFSAYWDKRKEIE
jgi:hypothetical protein